MTGEDHAADSTKRTSMLSTDRRGQTNISPSAQALGDWQLTTAAIGNPKTFTGTKAAWNAVNLIGERFGRLLVIARAPNAGSGRNKRAQWLCRCLCGKLVCIPTTNLMRGNTRTCGCGKARSQEQVIAKLFEHRRIGDNGCWEWTGLKDHGGYGTIGSVILAGDYTTLKVHRVSAHLWLGFDLAARQFDVCHKCDNRSCFNPDHLFIGTRMDNVNDCRAKGRYIPGKYLRDKTHCKWGHPFNEENTWRSKTGSRHCRACSRIRMMKRYYANRH